ncbi:hypothetical protein [Blastococcus sp. CT_GayMR16]|uniref:hypothetical protein n=1 Tax=Blastococcus sp. CT_GayMR16 TaxID=2559607 RepID=UPI001072F408|nr:hypothetical protein [Blastococcus sp. CT_GayMR16]TFV87144.1 hypothetical protein E4P38_14420 [Blastococcus sp. CT_GayMR16]
MVTGAPARPPTQGWQHRNLAAILSIWLIAAFLAIGAALQSDWAPFGELPTAAQVRQARTDAWSAGVVSVLPPAVGLLLARRWRSDGWTAAFLVGLMFAVLVSGALLWLTDSPVRPG